MSGAPSPVPQDGGFALVAADLAFFRRFPDRAYRLRLAGRAEIAEARAKVGLILPPPGVRVFCALRRIEPGRLHRAIGFAIDAGETDFSETTALTAYHLLNPQDVTAPPAPGALWRAEPVSLTGSR